MATPSGIVAGGPAPRLRLLVLQPTPFCNIDCSYCYLSDRKSTARMSLETLDLACQRVFETPWLDEQLEVAWHGGEPLTVPLAWYEEAMAVMARRNPAQLRLRHCFQTNGLLVNENWARFFARIGARVGLSIDGPADVHDANRRTRRGLGTHERAMRALRLMQDQGAPVHVITVLTQRALDEPERLFDFFVKNGITEVGFNIEEIEGANSSSSLAEVDVEEKFRIFIACFLKLVWNAPGLLRVREFDNAVGILLSDEAVRDQQNVPFAIVNVGYDGTVSTFSPELLGARHPRFDNFALGHIATYRLADFVNEPLFQAVNREIQDGVNACARSCRYFRWCGGGAPANKLFETGRFDATETMHCRLTRQIVLDQIIAGIEGRIEAAVAANQVDCIDALSLALTTRNRSHV